MAPSVAAAAASTSAHPRPTALADPGLAAGDKYVFDAKTLASGKPGPLEDFLWNLKEQPHADRRKLILQAHPEVRELMGHEPLTKYLVVFLVALQIGLSIALREHVFTWYFWLTAYCVGGTASSAIFLAAHETSHFLAFKSLSANRLFNNFVNLPIVLAYTHVFREYHMEHHMYLGVDGMDADIPTSFEAKLFSSRLGKLFFATFQIAFYALRPLGFHGTEVNKWFLLNWGTQLSFDFALWYMYGPMPFVYLLGSVVLGGSLHPSAAHFIAEHYAFLGSMETYSYYGVWNMFCFNVGYHNEHHDFPNIPWSRLPKLKALAPEFYDNLPQHESWTYVIYRFIMDPEISLYNRVKRDAAKKKAQ